ncbi:MAG: O-antigen ligase family protein [Candidatus Omnitrophica bacterium]|nr:O-antigen ligase family protein [Candidatus Omnitrophota bacterium]
MNSRRHRPPRRPLDQTRALSRGKALIHRIPEETQVDLKLFGILAAIVCCLAILVEKETQLPKGVLLMAGALGIGGLLISAFRSPNLPVYALTVYLPFNRVLVGDFGGGVTALNLTNILVGILLISWLSTGRKKENKFWTKSPLGIPVFLFAMAGALSLVTAASTFGSHYLSRYIFELKRWLDPLFIYYIVYNTVRNKKVIKHLTLIIGFTVTVVAAMAIKDYIDVGQVSSLEKSRIGGIAEQPNILGTFFCYYMFLLAAFWITNIKRLSAWGLLVPFLMCFRGIMVTFSRGAYLAFACGGMALTWFRSKIIFGILIFYIVAAMSNPVLLPSGIRYRMDQTWQNKQSTSYVDQSQADLEASADTRLKIWRGAFLMIQDYPLTGVGYGLFDDYIPQYAPDLRGAIDAHNQYLLIAGEMGIPALLIFLWILFIIWWKTRYLYHHAKDPFIKSMALGWLAGLAGVLIGNLFGSRLHSMEISGYFWILSALVMRAITLEKQEAAHNTPPAPQPRRTPR